LNGRLGLGDVRDDPLHHSLQRHRLVADVEWAGILQKLGDDVGDVPSLLQDMVGVIGSFTSQFLRRESSVRNRRW